MQKLKKLHDEEYISKSNTRPRIYALTRKGKAEAKVIQEWIKKYVIDSLEKNLTDSPKTINQLVEKKVPNLKTRKEFINYFANEKTPKTRSKIEKTIHDAYSERWEQSKMVEYFMGMLEDKISKVIDFVFKTLSLD